MRVRHPQTADRVAFEIELDDTPLLATTQPSWPGSIATICRRLVLATQPSAYSMWISLAREEPTCACMQSSVPTTGFMSTAQWNPTG